MSVIIGLVVVGVTDALYQSPGEAKGRNSLITGDLLIIVAQVVSSCQMVYEEKYVAGKAMAVNELYWSFFGTSVWKKQMLIGTRIVCMSVRLSKQIFSESTRSLKLKCGTRSVTKTRTRKNKLIL